MTWRRETVKSAGVSNQTLAEIVRNLEAGNPPGAGSGFLGANLAADQARLVLIPVPWDATTSYRPGTAAGPQAIVAASHQLDLEDDAFGRPYRHGIAFLPADPRIAQLNAAARPAAERAIAALEAGGESPDDVDRVNKASAEVMQIVRETGRRHLRAGQAVGLVGGDHSSPFGLLEAVAEVEPEGFGLLQIDAHHDFRRAYEGFAWSHASIAFNVMERLGDHITRLVQVGIRDYSREEADYAEHLGDKVRCWRDRELFRARMEGTPFAELTRRILADLPERVYVSFDIDGLEPQYCPSTGTPVPGGLGFNEAGFLLEAIVRSGRRLVGFDLCEVAPGSDGSEWDANVGARVLYRLCGALLCSLAGD